MYLICYQTVIGFVGQTSHVQPPWLLLQSSIFFFLPSLSLSMAHLPISTFISPQL